MQDGGKGPDGLDEIEVFVVIRRLFHMRTGLDDSLESIL